MVDVQSLLDQTNLFDLISQDTEVTRMKGRLYCPFCQVGGSQHNNSPALSIHDRRYKCFGCGASGDAIDYIMQRDQLDFHDAALKLGWDGGTMDTSHSQAAIDRREQERQAEKVRRQHELDALLADYSAEEIWQAYNRKMSADNRAWWRSRGIPDEWQDYLKLGYIPHKPYRGKDGLTHYSDAFTIPYFHTDFKFCTIQYRLVNPERPQDRYRFEPGLRAAYYQVDPIQPVGDSAIICEGAIKGMNVLIYGNLGLDTAVLAIPAKDCFGGIAEAVRNCSKVWLIPDPDAWVKPANAPANWQPAPVRLAREIGKASMIVNLPAKVDDMILNLSLNSSGLKALLKSSRRFS